MSKITWSFPLIFLVLTSCSAKNQSSVSIIKHWQYCYNDTKEITNAVKIPETSWTETDKLINPPKRNVNEVLWLRIPTNELKGSHLQIPRFGMEEYHVYFDTNKVFEQKSFRFSQKGGSFSGLSWQIIPVQRESTFCYIGVQSSLKDIGFWGKFYNGSRGELITAIIQRDILTLVVASIQIFAGILALLIFFLRKKDKIYLSLAMITISVALYSIFFTDIRSFFLFQNGWIAIWIGSIVFTSIGIVLYFSDLFQGLSKRLMEYSAIASFMYYIVIVLLHSFGILHIYNSRIPYYFFLLVNIPVIVYNLFKKTLHKNHEARIIIFAISILILSAIFEMFRAIWAIFPGFVSTTTFSINIFIILLAWISIKRYTDMYKKLAVYADDLQQLNTIYYKFVPREFLTLLGKNDIKHIRLGDNIQKEMAILFSDIRGFTTQSEKMSPSESFEFINSFLGEMSPVIRRHNGFIDKYIGDAIMALFPLGSDDAIKTALEMCETLNIINQKLALQNKPPVTIGIGIHYGKLMLGTVGESERMESTVISDAVNLASRLEQLTKEHNSTIIISEAAYDNASSETISEFKPLGEVTVKGKNIPVTIFGIT